MAKRKLGLLATLLILLLCVSLSDTSPLNVYLEVEGGCNVTHEYGEELEVCASVDAEASLEIVKVYPSGKEEKCLAVLNTIPGVSYCTRVNLKGEAGKWVITARAVSNGYEDQDTCIVYTTKINTVLSVYVEKEVYEPGETVKIYGSLRTADGRGIYGKYISLSYRDSSSGSIDEVKTDSQGRFKAYWKPLREGYYTIVAIFPGDEIYESAQASTVVAVIEVEKNLDVKVSPSRVNANPGDEIKVLIEVTANNWRSDEVELKVHTPPGISYSLSRTSGIPPYKASLTLNIEALGSGTYEVEVVASGGGLSAAKTIYIEIDVVKENSKLELFYDNRVKVGKEVAIEGRLYPRISTVLQLEITEPDGSRREEKIYTSSEGEFKKIFTVDKPGTWTIAVKWKGNEKYSPVERTINVLVEEATERKEEGTGSFLSSPFMLIVAIAAIAAIAFIVAKKISRPSPPVSPPPSPPPPPPPPSPPEEPPPPPPIP